MSMLMSMNLNIKALQYDAERMGLNTNYSWERNGVEISDKTITLRVEWHGDFWVYSHEEYAKEGEDCDGLPFRQYPKWVWRILYQWGIWQRYRTIERQYAR